MPQRWEKTSVKRTVAAPEFANYPGDWHMSPVLDTGEFVFLSGQTGCRPDGTVDTDPERQFREAFEFLNANLRKHLTAFIRAKDEYIFPPYPAWTAIGVTELITEGTLVEMRVIARRP
jgi:enamine deaminase RidA (YjgF/YER057c/UK114 family)